MKEYKFINKAGIELEGGWDDPQFEIGHDGSVSTDALVVGELASPALTPNEIESWMEKHYPDAVNATCGMHVHVSFKKNLYYARCMEKECYEHVKKYLLEWGKEKKIRKEHPFWERLKGKNTYCLDKFCPEKQYLVRDKGSERYAILNYTWARYNTIECRVLPAFKMKNIGISAVFAVLDAFETYLTTLKAPQREPSEVLKIEIPEQRSLNIYNKEKTLVLKDANFDLQSTVSLAPEQI